MGTVGWPDSSTGSDRYISDPIPAQSTLTFLWTNGVLGRNGQPNGHSGYTPYSEFNDTFTRVSRRFRQPNDPTITDWRQTIRGPNGSTEVSGANIEHNSPWSFQPLADLPDIDWRIPDLAPFQGDPDLTIYTAVNLGIYLTHNPNGFLDGRWHDGQTLDELGLEIINGLIAGLEGIYWSTTEFVFDADSETGWVPLGGTANYLDSSDFQAASGTIGIVASHVAVPEPSVMGLVLLSLVAVLAGYRRRSKSEPPGP